MFRSSQPQVASIVDVMCKEIQQSLGVPQLPQPQLKAMTYTAAARHHVPPPHPRQCPVTPQFRRPVLPPPAHRPVALWNILRKTDVWHAPDHRSLCYHCREAGHVYCRRSYREMGLRGFVVNASRPQLGERPRDIADYIAATQWTPRRPLCSPSPGHYRSLQRQPYTGPPWALLQAHIRKTKSNN